eukprot:6202323-Pleurochrysis_carterae.AAC.5
MVESASRKTLHNRRASDSQDGVRGGGVSRHLATQGAPRRPERREATIEALVHLRCGSFDIAPNKLRQVVVRVSRRCKGGSNAIRERRGRNERSGFVAAAKHRAQPVWVQHAQEERVLVGATSTVSRYGGITSRVAKARCVL